MFCDKATDMFFWQISRDNSVTIWIRKKRSCDRIWKENESYTTHVKFNSLRPSEAFMRQ